MKKMIYLTYAEPPSGVFSSQVIDVIQYINKELKSDIQLVSFISMHDFKKHKLLIRQQFPTALILPMLPKATYWRFNVILLWFVCLFIRPSVILARNVIAANMALKVRGKSSVERVCFDGRGAIAAEWKEYDVNVVKSWIAEIDLLEKRAVIDSDFRIAVSEKLVEYWKEVYAYSEQAHVVIPCTLNSNFKEKPITLVDIELSRAKFGFNVDDIVLAYSGSTAGWQSFSILYPYLSHYLNLGRQYKVIFLAPEEENITKLEQEFPGQVIRKWVAHSEVPSVLMACDIGILIREQSITNKVASPTKFAEYLSAGLPVIITENLGDYSSFVAKHNCGYVVTGNEFPLLSTSNIAQRTRMVSLVQDYCTKGAYLNQYRKLVDKLSS